MVSVRRLAPSLFLIAMIAGPAVGQPRGIATVPPPSAEVEAAMAKVRAGDRSELTRLADAGNAEAQMYLGIVLSFAPEATPATARKGCSYIETASMKRGDAMHALGESYQYGRCGPKDLDKAVATFEKAARMGNVKSKCAAGNVLAEQGREPARAVALCREAAEAGDPDAQTDLANFYISGRLVAKDAVEARRWYEKAAAQGHPNAAFTLGQIHFYGDGTPKNPAESVRLWRIAYAGGREDAALWLGREAFMRALPDAAAGRSAPGQARVVLEPLVEAIGWFEKVPADDPGAKDAHETLDLLRDLKAKAEAQRTSGGS